MSVRDIPFSTADGGTQTLADHEGKVVLVVNVASKCGLTPQYAGLEALYRAKQEQGLVVLGIPSNDFRGQEPGTDAEIQEFCSTQYDVTFPVAAKTVIVGEDKHPLYAALVAAQPHADGKAEMREGMRGRGIEPTEDPEVLWNFEKFLVARDGSVVARFAPTVAPDDPALLARVERELAS